MCIRIYLLGTKIECVVIVMTSTEFHRIREQSFFPRVNLFIFIFSQVTDTNDNPPVFSDNAYSFDVPENTIRGTRVGEIMATDEDEGINGQVSYQVISDWANDVFSLNSQSGVFTLTTRLDYEEVRFVRLLLLFSLVNR